MKLKINNYNWTIKFVPKEEIENKLGTTNFADLEIKIRKEQKQKVFIDSVFHEITHAYMFSYGFDKDNYNYEEVVCFITQNWANIKALTDSVFLLKDDKEEK